MKDNSYYNECIDGSIRKAVADNLMTIIPSLSKLKGEEYYQAEDAICDFIKTNSRNIYYHLENQYDLEDAIYYLSERNLIPKSYKALEKFVSLYRNLKLKYYGYGIDDSIPFSSAFDALKEEDLFCEKDNNESFYNPDDLD